MPGEIVRQIDPATLERIFRAVRKIESSNTTGGAPPSMPASAVRTISVVNMSGLVIPAGGVAYLDGMDDDAEYHRAYRPTNPGRVSIAVAVDEIPIGSTGCAWPLGTLPRVRCSDWATLSVGDCIGCGTYSFNACTNPLGPMTVAIKLAAPFVVARFHGRRGNCIFIRSANGRIFGPCYVLNIGPGLTFVQEQLGVVRIERT